MDVLFVDRLVFRVSGMGLKTESNIEMEMVGERGIVGRVEEGTGLGSGRATLCAGLRLVRGASGTGLYTRAITLEAGSSDGSKYTYKRVEA
jgi:hypothetical protein